LGQEGYSLSTEKLNCLLLLVDEMKKPKLTQWHSGEAKSLLMLWFIVRYWRGKMKTYTVTVDSYGNIRWRNEIGQYHREDGPAREYVNGTKEWYVNDRHLTETEFNAWRKVVEVTIEEIEKILGHKVKIVKGRK
jgi:hypothetical protein